MSPIEQKIRDASLRRYRDRAVVVADVLREFSNSEALAILDLARAELLLEIAQNASIVNQTGEQNRH